MVWQVHAGLTGDSVKRLPYVTRVVSVNEGAAYGQSPEGRAQTLAEVRLTPQTVATVAYCRGRSSRRGDRPLTRELDGGQLEAPRPLPCPGNLRSDLRPHGRSPLKDAALGRSVLWRRLDSNVSEWMSRGLCAHSRLWPACGDLLVPPHSRQASQVGSLACCPLCIRASVKSSSQ